jgi:MurNAc alpha-1-phosphate uridylyltransferase
MPDVPEAGMVLAAGRGVRMAPVSDTLPKPLVTVLGKALIECALKSLVRAEVCRIVVNAHHLADQIAAYLARRSWPPGVRYTLSREEALLETGGGVKRVLSDLGVRPFFVLNGDIYWRDGATPALLRLVRAFDDARMDALLLLHPVKDALGYEGRGDFSLESDGRLKRRGEGETAPYLFTGIQILTPRLFENAPEGPFSLNILYRKAEAVGRLHGLVHDGLWCHVSRPADIALTEAWLAEHGGGV